MLAAIFLLSTIGYYFLACAKDGKTHLRKFN
jgi:hypothetical protein